MYGHNSSFSHNAMLIELCPQYQAFVLIGIHNTSVSFITQGTGQIINRNITESIMHATIEISHCRLISGLSINARGNSGSFKFLKFNICSFMFDFH
jgi:hypothetical protein